VRVRWEVPEGLRVLADGSWRVGDLPIAHAAGLRYLKAHLVFENGGSYVAVGPARVPVAVGGPAFQAIALHVRPESGTAAVALDDGSEEPVGDDAIGMDPVSGRFECLVRGGKARAVLTRPAHQTLLEHAAEQGGRFFLRAGGRSIPIRT
jgi:hypothetical protein